MIQPTAQSKRTSPKWRKAREGVVNETGSLGEALPPLSLAELSRFELFVMGEEMLDLVEQALAASSRPPPGTRV